MVCFPCWNVSSWRTMVVGGRGRKGGRETGEEGRKKGGEVQGLENKSS